MHIFALTATCELRVSRKSHLRDHPSFVPKYETLQVLNFSDAPLIKYKNIEIPCL